MLTRRSFLVLLGVLLAAPAHADMAVPAPPPVELRGERSMVTTDRGGPSHAFFTIVNRGDRPARVRLAGLVHQLPTMRVPLSIRSVLRDGQPAARELELGPGEQARLEIHFDGLSEADERLRRWSFELRADVTMAGGRGGRVSGTAEVARGIRHPIRR